MDELFALYNCMLDDTDLTRVGLTLNRRFEELPAGRSFDEQVVQQLARQMATLATRVLTALPDDPLVGQELIGKTMWSDLNDAQRHCMDLAWQYMQEGH